MKNCDNGPFNHHTLALNKTNSAVIDFIAYKAKHPLKERTYLHSDSEEYEVIAFMPSNNNFDFDPDDGFDPNSAA